MMDRRAFLRRAGAAALALPLLQLPRRAYGQLDPGFPHRLLVFFTPNGTKKELWSPKQEHGDTRERGYTMGSLLRPLLPFQDRMVLFDGIDLAVAAEGPGGPHQRGMASLLTGAVITEGDFVGGDGRRAGWGGGISIDQLIARHLQPATRLTTFELGVRVLESLPRARMIYGGPEQPLPPENDPVVAFTRAFEGVDADPAVMRRRLLRRQSVLDAVKGDFRDLQSRVSRVDREKLERHAEALRDLERRLAVVAEQPGLCQGEAPQREADVMAQGAYATLLDQQADIVVNALACDVT
ncbi:MAG: DUF1552 domain-containing protein, partial [Myxococcales bacterium]|nr:DUF1552 domain-containing protein [Myxococcales bacterium]